MEPQERMLFYELLRNATLYQEFGAGGSTVVALMHKSIKHMHTVESAQEWINLLSKRKDVHTALNNGRLALVHGNIGPTSRMGHPANTDHQPLWPDYSGKYAESPIKFDLVFVDGRFRVACLLKALARAPIDRRSSIVFAMHDYTNRPNYHVVEEFVDVVQTAKTLAVFRAKDSINMTLLNETIHKYDYIHEQQ